MILKKRLSLIAMLVALIVVVSNSGCGGGQSAPPPPISVSLTPSTAQSVGEGQTVNFTASVMNDSSGKGVTWSLSGTGCAGSACGTLSNQTTTTATYTAPSTVVAGLSVTITATSAADTGKSASTPIAVAAISVSITPSSATVQVGGTAQLTATVTNDSANKGVTWTVSCSPAPCGSVSPTATSSGTATTYTAPTTPHVGNLTVTLTATSAADTIKSASATIKVPAITVSVLPSAATVQLGATAQFTATVTNDSANKGVTWAVLCSAAPCGSVSPTATGSGASTTYTAPSTPPASNLMVTLKATSVTDNTKSASATVTVPSVGVSVMPTSVTVEASTTAQFTATVAGDSSNKGVTWAVSCSPSPCGSVAPTSTASGTATTYTAPATPPASDLTVILTATSVVNPLAVGSASITVPAITVSIAPPSARVAAGTTAQFTATVTNDSANKGVTWAVSCSAAPCGTVSLTSTASGTANTYTAPTTPPASNVSVTLTATSVADATKSATANITVLAITVAVAPPSGIIPIKATQPFTATVNFDSSNKGANWTLAQNGAACSSACGAVNPTSTASGTPTTYTGPATVPANATVTITATSVVDTSKSASATITLTNGTVKLIPASLNFRCKIQRNLPSCSSGPQTITLTNTGSAALTINSIAITGTNANLFSQTNDCGTSVAAPASCSVNVKLTSSIAGNFTAAVSFSDGSPDSPQQVALSATVTRFFAAAAAAAQSDLASTTSATVPAPMGTEMVGTRVLQLLDATREDPYLANGTKRELAVRFWYPAFLNQKCEPADYASPAVWKQFAQLVGVRPFPVTTNSCLNAPIADGVHPVVVFTPGYTATFTDYTFLLEDLASRGYVVASVAHTYETTTVELSGGRMATSVVGSHLGGPIKADDQSLSSATYVRLQDLEFVLNEMGRLNTRADSPFANHLDMSEVAIAGHSLGGLTAFLASQFDPRFQAAIIMDGFVPAALPSATKMPVLILAAGRERWEPTESHLWSNLAGPRLAVNLRGTEHVALSDWLWLTPDSVTTGPMGPERTMAAVRDYIAAFLDATLLGKSMDPLLTGSSPEYPDAEVTTQNEFLRGKP